MPPAGDLPLAPMVVLVEKELIEDSSLSSQQVQAQVTQQVQTKFWLREHTTPKYLHQTAPKTPAPKACVPGKCIGDRGITAPTVIIMSLMSQRMRLDITGNIGSAFIRPDSIMTDCLMDVEDKSHSWVTAGIKPGS